MNYQYWVIQYIPDLVRGEYSNIGVVCGHDGHDWSVRLDRRFAKSRAAAVDAVDLAGWMNWFERRIQRHDQFESAEREVVTASWIAQLRTRQASSIQISPATPIEAQSSEEAITLLYSLLVDRGTQNLGRVGEDMTGLIPVGMSHDELADLLLDMSERVRRGDSYEGNIEYHFPEECTPEPGWPDPMDDFWVRGVYRVGNLEGQGGVRMVGSVPG